jgi:hypothetical protein
VPGADSAMIVAPGGGYGFLAIGREGTDIAAWLNEIGVSAFVLKYRVPSRSWMSFGAAPLQDAQRAMVKKHQLCASCFNQKIFLPRQARDKHRENSKTQKQSNWRFLRGSSVR